MRLLDLAGLAWLEVGLLLLLLFLVTAANPNVGMADFGLVSLVIGALVICCRSFGTKAGFRGKALLLASAGYLVLSGGVVAAVAGYLLEDQLLCMCPMGGVCSCTSPLYSGLMQIGLLAIALGVAPLGAAVAIRSMR